nr:protein phosphatase 2C domain-containing protein [Zhihengliuella sp.]
MRFVHGFATDRGLRRELNEDSVLAAETLFAVADGMGGHEAGEVASRVCVETLAAGYRAADGRLEPEDIHQLMGQADRAIREAACERAGTTLAGAAVVEHEGAPHWLVFNVGDSRTYRYSHARLAQVSVDHSEVQMLVDSGEISLEQAIVHPRRNVITRALGAGDDPRPEFWMMPVEIGDRLLICSDGLSGEVRDADIQSILERFPSAQDAVDELVQAALRNGGRDNVSVVVVDAVAGHPDDPLADTRPRRHPEADSTTTEPGVGLFGAGRPGRGPTERGARQSPHRGSDDRGTA